MKQSIKFISLFLFMAVILIVSTSQKAKNPIPKQQQKKYYTVVLDGDTWVKVLYCIEQSNAAHPLVKQSQDSLNKQLYDTTFQSKMEKLLK